MFVFLNSALFLVPFYLFRNIKTYFILSLFLLSIPALFDLAHIFLYQGKMTSSIFFIIFDTVPTETMEYLHSNFSFKLSFFIILYLGGLFILVKSSFRRANSLYKKSTTKFLLLFIVLPMSVKFVSTNFNVSKVIQSYTRSNQLFLMIETFLEYQNEMKIFARINANLSKIEGVKALHSKDLKEVHVLVLGESTTRNNMSLYGYQRKTNPLLESIKDDLYVFQNISSPHPPSTASCLKKILTLTEKDLSSENLLRTNVIGLFNALDFETYWLSNQLILGEHDTVTTALAKQSKNVTFTNTTNSTNYDEKLLPIFEERLKLNEKKQFFVLHLMGSHMKYRNRFPKEFKKFKTDKLIEKKAFHNKEKIQYINSYDNAILYNDYVVYNIIKILKKKNVVSSLIYLSDHGEEVYRDKDLHGHPKVDTKSLYQIPFIVWTSESFAKQFPSKEKNFSEILLRKYAHNNLIHSMADLYGINFPDLDETKSLFSDQFLERSRYIDSLK